MSENKKAIREFMLYILSGFAAYVPLFCLGYLIAMGGFKLSALLGALYGSAVMIIYYLLFALATVRAAEETDPDIAKKRIQSAHTLRMFYLVLAMGAGVVISMEFELFNAVALIASMFVPRIAIAVWQIIQRKKEARGNGN